MAVREQKLVGLTAQQKRSYEEKGFLRLERVFAPEEIAELSDELDFIMQTWTTPGRGWEGPWRQKYLTADQEQKAQLSAIHELECYAASWARAILKPALADAIAELI